MKHCTEMWYNVDEFEETRIVSQDEKMTKM